ncbi:MAG: hypothetical protein GC151_20915 [Betaproteobacteria bacterium]|nr:hypothetical protein [Betaproteobacteria bacterium]
MAVTRSIGAGVGLLLAATAGVTHAGETRFGLEAGVRHESNVNRGLSGQELSDQALGIEGYAMRSFMTGARSGIVTRAALRGDAYRTNSDLSQLAATARVNWRFQPNPVYTGAWLDLFATAEVRRYEDSPIRDGELASLGAGLGKYFTDRLRLAGDASIERRYGRESDVFDLTDRRLHGTIDYHASPALTLYGSATWIDGDQVFGYGYYPGAPSDPAYNGRTDWFSAEAWDPAFDHGNLRYRAYRADATTKVFELGGNYAFSGEHAMDLSVSRFDSSATNGPGYAGYTVRALYLLRLR